MENHFFELTETQRRSIITVWNITLAALPANTTGGLVPSYAVHFVSFKRRNKIN